MSDAFSPPEDHDDNKVVVQRKPGELPELGTLLSETMEDITENIAGYALAGLGLFFVTFIMVFVAIFVLYGGMAVIGIGAVMIGALIGGDIGPLIAMLGGMVGFFLLMFVFMGVMMGTLLPVQASLERSIRDHIHGRGQLGIHSAFTSLFTDIVPLLLAGMGLIAASMVGILALYVGALVAGWALYWTISLVALDRRGAMDALKTSLSRVTGDMGGVGVLTLVTMLLGLVASYVPIIGPMFAISLKVRAHEAIFGEYTES